MDDIEYVVPQSIVSPCTNICRIAADGMCDGCNRTREEIARWTAMSAAERDALMESLPARPRVAR